MILHPKVVCVVVWFVLVATSRAFEGPPQPSQTFTSPTGLSLVRLIPLRRTDGGSGDLIPTVLIAYRLNEDENGYSEIVRFQITHQPWEVLISDDASHIVTVGQYKPGQGGSPAVAVYDSVGKMLKKWDLSDFSGRADLEREISRRNRNINTASWIGKTYWSEDQKAVYMGPPLVIEQTGKDHGKERIYLDLETAPYVLTLRSLTIRREEPGMQNKTQQDKPR